MRVLAFSDLHRDVDTTNNLWSDGSGADFIVVAGDFAVQGVRQRRSFGNAQFARSNQSPGNSGSWQP